MKPAHLDAMFSFRNEAKSDEPLEILIYEAIGKDPWTGEGLSSLEFAARLEKQPKNREISLRVNSRGGYVHEGLPPYNLLNQWQGRVVGTVDGVAASIASVMLMACDEIRMPKASQMLIHDAWGATEGDEAEHAKSTERLRITSDMLAGIYAEKTGLPKDQIRDWMRGTKLMNGEEAKALGFADTLIDGNPLYNFTPTDLHAIRAMAGVGQTGGKPPQPQGELMDRSKILALLNKAGVTVDDKATEEQLLELLAKNVNKPAPAAPSPQNSAEIVELRNALTALTEQRNAERKDRVTRAVHQAVLDDKISLDQQDTWIDYIMTNEKALDLLNKMNSKPPGVKAPKMVFEQNAAPDIVLNAMEENIVRGHIGTAGERGAANGKLFAQNRDKVLQMMNAGTNTISADLKLNVILNEAIRAFAKRLLPLRMFSTSFSNVPLAGTDTVTVPYFPLRADASTNWVAADGYVMGGTAEAGAKKITVNVRKYQPLDYTSDTLARQPFYDVVKLLQMNAEKLAVDVMADILSLITNASFGAAAVTIDPAVATADDIIDLRKACNAADWPIVGRGLISNNDLDTGLMKDSAFKNAMAFGGAEVMRTGQLPNFLGFEYASSASLPANAEKLIGAAVFPSAILAAFSPVNPAPGVRGSLIDYSVIVDAQTGMAFNFRHWADSDMDTDKMVLEIAYGKLVGESAACKRIVSP